MKKTLLLHLIILSSLSINALAQSQWVKLANFGGEGRHRCVAFSVGNKGYIGGGRINSGTEVKHEDFWQYDPGSDTWTQIADYAGGKRFHQVAFSIDEFGYVGCGEDDVDTYHNDFYRYAPQFNIWQPIANLPGNPRRGAVSFIINGEGFVGTGQSDFGYENDFFKYIPEDDAWYSIQDFLGEARSSAVGFSNNGLGYVGTGHIWGDHTKDFYEYNPGTDTWSQKADVGPTFRQDATGFALNGKGYIGTGNDNDGNINYKDFWQYDFDTDTWTQIEDFGAEGRRYMVSFVIGNVAYAGTGTDGTNLRDFYMFNPILSAKNSVDQFVVRVYPNPATEFVTFDFSNEQASVKLFSIDGKLIHLEENILNKVTFDVSGLPNGTYLFQIESIDNQFYSGQLVIE